MKNQELYLRLQKYGEQMAKIRDMQMAQIKDIQNKSKSRKVKEGLEEQIYKLSNDLKTADDLTSSQKTEIKELKREVEATRECMEYVKEQLDNTKEIIRKKDDLIHKLGLLLIDSTNKVDGQ